MVITAWLPLVAVLTLPVSHGVINSLQAGLPKEECRLTVDYCQSYNTSKCLGTTLPYTSSSIILASDSDTEREVLEKLGLWAGLINVPKCWEVIQPFLCAVYMPRCYTEGNDSFIVLPGQELCEQTRKPCKVVASYSAWPDFLQCNQSHFPPGCSAVNPVSTLQFNTTSTCELPLVATDNKNSWYEDIDGCGVQCENPLFTDAEHDEVHMFIAVFGSLCLFATLYTVLSFLIDWKNASRYPALILFFINACFFIGSIGWMAQFVPGARKDIVCRSDGTMRKLEPQLGSGETASCTVIFILVYYFMMAGVTWFVILAYAWHLTFRALGYPRDAIEGKRGHFHLVAWSFPLVLTIVCLALTQIDGDSVSGICFVGYLNHSYRGYFLLLPLGVVMVVGFGFLLSGLVTLIRIQMDTPGLISDKATAKIRETIIRLGVFASLALLFVIVTFVMHVYIFTNEPLWKKSFEDYIICEGNVTIAKSVSNRTKTCTMKSRPNLVAMEIHIFAYFGAGIVMSSWAWNKATLETWKRFLRKRFTNAPEEKNPAKLRKHEVIAQAFNRRREMNDGRISLSFYSAHDDPIGMKFDMNSVSSLEMSSAWAAALPRMIMRRGGMAQPNARRFSDSDVQSIQSTSFGPVSGVLIESHSPRRNSMNSHGSQSQSDKEESRKKKKKKRRHRRGVNRIAPIVASSLAGADVSSKTGSIEPMSSLAPSSRCTSLVSSMAEHPNPQRTDVVDVVIHQEPSDHEDEEVEEIALEAAADSDSINSEDSNFTVQNNEGEDATEQDANGINIPSQKSAFKKYSNGQKQKKTEIPTASMRAHHHHHTSTYSMVTAMGYMPPGVVPDYPDTCIPAGYTSPTGPYASPNGPYASPNGPYANPYTVNNYPMTFMPQDYYMSPPGFVPQPGYYPNMPNTMSPPFTNFHMASPPQGIYNPFEQMVHIPQKVPPVPYNKTKKTHTHTKPDHIEMTEIEVPVKPKKHLNDNNKLPVMAFLDKSIPKPIFSGEAQRSKIERLQTISPPKSSSTYHLDRVELEDISDVSV